MNTSITLTIRELMKEEIHISFDRLNSHHGEEYGNKVLSTAQSFAATVIHSAKQSADHPMFCGEIILKENSGGSDLVGEEQPFILHFIFLAAIINELHHRNMVTAEVNCIFEDLLKCETVYRIHLDKGINQFFRDHFIDCVTSNRADCQNYTERCFSETYTTYKNALKGENDLILFKIMNSAINSQFVVNYQ